MIKNPTIVVELRSHTDARDTEEKNDELSQKRAQSCVDFLVLEKGIAPDRIVPKGYGERVPRRLEKDMYSIYNGKSYFFAKGTHLTEEYINSLPSKPEQEAAHALNRRTEFTILRDDYVPSNDSIAKVPTGIAVIQERSLPITIDGNTISGNCYANSKSLKFQIGDNSSEIFMNYNDATRFLKESIISLEDFEEKAAAIKQEDGSIIEGAILYLEELRIGDEYSENVKVTVKKNLPAAFVVGDQYIKEEWGDFNIDNNRNMLIYR